MGGPGALNYDSKKTLLKKIQYELQYGEREKRVIFTYQTPTLFAPE